MLWFPLWWVMLSNPITLDLFHLAEYPKLGFCLFAPDNSPEHPFYCFCVRYPKPCVCYSNHPFAFPFPHAGGAWHTPSLACEIDALSCPPGCKVLSSDQDCGHRTHHQGTPQCLLRQDTSHHPVGLALLSQDASVHQLEWLPPGPALPISLSLPNVGSSFGASRSS